MIAIYPFRGIGEVAPGSDLASLLLAAMGSSGLAFEHGDILVVTQKIVSKAENRFVELSNVHPGPEAMRIASITGKDPQFVELVLSESREIVRAAPNVLITRHWLGFVMANAGIDRSNLGPNGAEQALLLPCRPDHSAETLRHAIANGTGVAPAVIVSDSFGRPWRNGVVGVAIGTAGITSLLDRRGELDRDGRPLEVTQVAIGDLLASAAALATGEGSEGVPAALIRGAIVHGSPRTAAALIRPVKEDLFR